MRAFSRLSTSLATLPFLLPALTCPHLAAAQDITCAVGAPAGETDDPHKNEAAEARSQLHRLATGAGVKVAVIDTGVAGHPQLNQLSGGADFVTPDTPEPFKDCDAHGTVVAGIIAGTDAGIAPDAEILSIRQSSAHYRSPAPRGEDAPTAATMGDLETLTRAIHNALDENAKVINISVVSCVEPELAPRVDTRGLKDALGRAEHSGAVVVAAAGNLSRECPAGSTVFPAHFPTVLAVGARADSHTIADYSLPVPEGATLLTAPGTVEHASAPGVRGWSVGKAGERDEIEPFAGTSFAAPVVSGTVALLRQRHPHATPAQLRDMITASAEPRGGAVDPLRTVSFVEREQSADTAPLRARPIETIDSAAPHRSSFTVASVVLVAALAVAVGAFRRILLQSRTRHRSIHHG